MARDVECDIETLFYEVGQQYGDIYGVECNVDIRNDVNSIIREPRIAAWMRADL